MYDSANDINKSIKQIDRELGNLSENATDPTLINHYEDLRRELKRFNGEMVNTKPVAKYRTALSEL
jgi:hypothetical protein